MVTELEQVTVIIVTYNSAHCLPVLAAYLKLFPHIIVVDNGSNDDCAQLTPKHLPQAQVLALGRNLGFGAANNRALAQVKTTFALLLNPDCEITPEAVAQLMRTASVWPQAAIIAPQLLDTHNRPEINYRWPHHLWNSQGPGIENQAACVGFICGAAMLLRISEFEQIGGFFDEDFFLYYEDDDLCTRLFNNRQALIIDPESTAVHRSRGSVRGRSPLRSEYTRGYHHAQSKVIYARKYKGNEFAASMLRSLIWKSTLAFLVRLLIPSPKHVARICGRIMGLLQLDIKAM